MTPLEKSISAGYEIEDASPRLAALTGGVLLTGVVASLAAALALYLCHYSGLPRSNSSFGRQTSFRESAEQKLGIIQDRENADNEARARLKNYGWINRKTGTLHLPIDQAMDVLLKEQSEKKNPPQPVTREKP